MAFCPECGKPGTANAEKCVHCGHELAPKEKSAGAAGGRFKGTMIMQSAPAAVPAAAPAPAAEPHVASVPPKASGPSSAPALASAPASKPMLKATMLGAGISPPTAAPGPGDEKRKMAFAATQPQQSAYVPPTAAAPASSGEARRDTPTGGQKKYLPGDPMAPGLGSSSTKLGGRGSDSGTDPKQPSAAFLVGFGVVGMIVIAGVGLLVAKYMGLL